MGTSLPIYVQTQEIEVEELSDSEAGTATQILTSGGLGCAGVLVRGVLGELETAGGKVTINIYDAADVSDAVQYYSVELDHTTLTTTSDSLDPGVPLLVDPYITITADATADEKEYNCIVYLQKIAVRG